MRERRAEKTADESADAGDPDDSRLITMLVIAGLLALVAWLLHAFAGEHWWRLLLVLIAVPLLFWTTARGRDRYMSVVARKADLKFNAGFPRVPPGTPAFGRPPWGFTGYTMSGQQNGVPLHVYEHSYRWMRSGTTSRAHGIWWQFETPLFPAFDVSVRTRLDGLTSLLSIFRRGSARLDSEMKEIVFRDDPAFSDRFVVRGAADSQIRRLFTPRLRQALLAELHRGTVGGKGIVLAWDRPGRLWGAKALATLMLKADRLRQAFNEERIDTTK